MDSIFGKTFAFNKVALPKNITSPLPFQCYTIEMISNSSLLSFGADIVKMLIESKIAIYEMCCEQLLSIDLMIRLRIYLFSLP